MRYVIYGAGAIGASMGALLAADGRDVTLVARGAHLEALRRDGVLLRWPGGREQRVAVRAVADAAEAGADRSTVVVLAVKSQDTAGAIDDLAALGQAPSVVCAQNGVDNERQALRRFEHVYGMCVVMPASHLEPGTVEVRNEPVPGMVDLGRYPTGVDATAEAVAADLRSAGFESEAHTAIMARKYRKLLANLTNALDAAAGQDGRRGPLADAARAEALACLDAAGIEVASEQEDLDRRRVLDASTRPFAASGPSSSWQSLARRGGRIEVDYLNGEIVLLGRLHGVDVPVNAWLAALAGDLARSGAEPGSVPIAELEHRARRSGLLPAVSPSLRSVPGGSREGSADRPTPGR